MDEEADVAREVIKVTAQVVEALCITYSELCKLLRSGRGNNCQYKVEKAVDSHTGFEPVIACF
jgi:hypothetical protein